MNCTTKIRLMVATLPFALLALAACSETRETIREKYTGERYGAPVEGPRRAPLLNPQAQASTNAPSPYDQFDAKGNPAQASAFVRPTAQAAEPGLVRKPFRGLAAAETAPPAPMLQKRPVNEAPQMQPEPFAPEPEDNGVFIPDEVPVKHDKSASAEQQFAELAPASGGVAPDYPHLSEVPKAPARFKEMKKEAAPAEQDLKTDHDAAMEEKKRLEEEPTELPKKEPSASLPQVEGVLKEISGAIHGMKPIVVASAQ